MDYWLPTLVTMLTDNSGNDWQATEVLLLPALNRARCFYTAIRPLTQVYSSFSRVDASSRPPTLRVTGER